MKLFAIFLVAVLITMPASAQTRINDEMTKAYYDSCLGKRDQRMSREAQDEMCACTSVKMQESMSIEDVHLMGENTQAGRNMLNKMLLDVYTPCIGVPLAEIIEDQCLMDGNVQGRNMRKNALCSCAAEKTAEWFTTNGREMMAEILNSTPNITDPINPVLASDKFRNASFAGIMECQRQKKK